MNRKASITVLRPRDELERLWRDPSIGPADLDASVEFRTAPGDRGTEIHLEVGGKRRHGLLGEARQKLSGTDPLARAKDELRRFKQLVETGVIARSDSTPGGERVTSKRTQRPAQPAPSQKRAGAGV